MQLCFGKVDTAKDVISNKDLMRHDVVYGHVLVEIHHTELGADYPFNHHRFHTRFRRRTVGGQLTNALGDLLYLLQSFLPVMERSVPALRLLSAHRWRQQQG